MTDNVELNTMEIILNESNLTKQQKVVLQKVYIKSKENIITIFENINKDSDALEISNSLFKIICLIIKIIEKVKLNRKKLSGEEKKMIVLELIRISILSEIDDKVTQTIILNAYDMSAESILETVLDLSRNVNISLNKGLSNLFKCCKN